MASSMTAVTASITALTRGAAPVVPGDRDGCGFQQERRRLFGFLKRSGGGRVATKATAADTTVSFKQNRLRPCFFLEIVERR